MEFRRREICRFLEGMLPKWNTGMCPVPPPDILSGTLDSAEWNSAGRTDCKSVFLFLGNTPFKLGHGIHTREIRQLPDERSDAIGLYKQNALLPSLMGLLFFL